MPSTTRKSRKCWTISASDDRPRLRVFNKIDILTDEQLASLARGNGNIYISALQGTGLQDLLERVDAVMPVDPFVHLRFSLPLSDGRTLALVHGLGRVLNSEVDGDSMRIDAELPESLVRRLKLNQPQTVSTEA